MTGNDEADDYEKERREAFETARAYFPSASSTLPKGYLKENGERLVLIAAELMQSYRTELRLVFLVQDVDTADTRKVDRLSRELKRYMQERLFTQERTKCGNICRLAAEMRKPFAGGSQVDERQLRDFKEVLDELSNFDNEFLDDLEGLSRDAYSAAEAMRHALPEDIEVAATPVQIQESKRIQANFVRSSNERIEKAKKALGALGKLVGDLLDIASGQKEPAVRDQPPA